MRKECSVLGGDLAGLKGLWDPGDGGGEKS